MSLPVPPVSRRRPRGRVIAVWSTRTARQAACGCADAAARGGERLEDRGLVLDEQDQRHAPEWRRQHTATEMEASLHIRLRPASMTPAPAHENVHIAPCRTVQTVKASPSRHTPPYRRHRPNATWSSRRCSRAPSGRWGPPAHETLLPSPLCVNRHRHAVAREAIRDGGPSSTSGPEPPPALRARASTGRLHGLAQRSDPGLVESGLR
jgi:hypothetical protein